ncbi:hypothetical protein [Aeromonas media]|uniref:hypothetical protein n=1 Tax=Aeromonas media TaxID=651 RepID=UPI003D2493EB
MSDKPINFKYLDPTIRYQDAFSPFEKGMFSQAIIDVLAERHRQVNQEGWNAETDDNYQDRELAAAAINYAAPHSDTPVSKKEIPFLAFWPFAKKWWKPSSYRRNLVKAIALLIAELERLDRAEKKPEN